MSRRAAVHLSMNRARALPEWIAYAVELPGRYSFPLAVQPASNVHPRPEATRNAVRFGDLASLISTSVDCGAVAMHRDPELPIKWGARLDAAFGADASLGLTIYTAFSDSRTSEIASTPNVWRVSMKLRVVLHYALSVGGTDNTAGVFFPAPHHDQCNITIGTPFCITTSPFNFACRQHMLIAGPGATTVLHMRVEIESASYT